MTSELRNFEVTIPGVDGKSVAEVVPLLVPMEWDDDAQDWVLTTEAMAMIDGTKARHMGLLTPKEICDLRVHWGRTQEQMAELLKLGAKTWSRWETGRQRPSQSLNLLLRALKVGLLTPYLLGQLDRAGFDWSEAIFAAAVRTEPVTLVIPVVEADDAVAGSYEEMPLAS